MSAEQLVYVIGHRNPDTDSVCSAIAYAHLKNCLGEHRVRAARAGELNAETTLVLKHFGVPPPELLTDAAGRTLILVDHNEVAQALPNIDRAHIVEVWEHHRLGDLHLPEPIFIHCEPVGATATLIAERYFASGITPIRAMAGLMIASILSDTIGFRSPTTTDKDRAVAARLQPLAEIDLDAFGRQLLQAKTAATAGQSPAEMLTEDFKEFRIGGRRIGIAQAEVAEAAALAGRREEILREMRALLKRQSLSQLIFMVTDLSAGGSDLWWVGDDRELLERAFGPLDDDIAHVLGCMSRKKQVVPRLEQAAANTSAAPSSSA